MTRCAYGTRWQSLADANLEDGRGLALSPLGASWSCRSVTACIESRVVHKGDEGCKKSSALFVRCFKLRVLLRHLETKSLKDKQSQGKPNNKTLVCISTRCTQYSYLNSGSFTPDLLFHPHTGLVQETLFRCRDLRGLREFGCASLVWALGSCTGVGA